MHINLTKNKGPKHRLEYTLIELLITISILIILISLLLPALSKAKASQITCASNLKQFNILILNYMQDHKEYFPKCFDGYDINEQGRWYRKLIYYMGDDPALDSFKLKYKRLFYCPSNPTPGFNSTTISYGFNYFLGNYWAGASGWHRIEEIKNPTETILIADSSSGYTVGPVGYKDDGYGPSDERAVSERHTTGANILWVDGHTSWKKKIEVYCVLSLFDRL